MIFLLVLVLAVIIFVFYKKLKKSRQNKVFEQYSCEEGIFIVKGRRDNFKVKKMEI